MKNILSSCNTLIWASKQLFKAAPFEFVVLFLFLIFQGVIPAASLYAIQGIINWVSSTSIFPPLFLVVWGSLLFADTVLSPIISIMRLQLNEKVLVHCNLLLMMKANALQSLDHFENPHFYDEIQFLKTESSRRPLNFVYVLTGFAKDFISLLSVLAVLATLGWWIPVGILIASFPHAAASFWFERSAWDQMLFRSPESRKMAWISSIPLDDRLAKELRLFGFGPTLINKYKEIASMTNSALSKERWKQSRTSLFLSCLTVVANIVIISFVLFQAKESLLPIGGLVISIQALMLTQTQLAGCIANIGMATPIALFFGKLKSFLESLPSKISEKGSFISPDFFNEIRFDNVSFSYPDSRKALSNVSFKIRKGEKIAIVGENGAGKSTLIKLLLRFYDPTEGIITVDGKDLKTLDAVQWRTFISGVFQDFGQYHLTVAENIALGDIGASQERIAIAAGKGGISHTLERLPQGMHTLLGKEFGGTALSGGEWQKLAMSRAFLRESKLIILDEPTSSLDPLSEQEIFKKFAEQAQGKTTLLITHRLGSVKMADRILVFRNGRLIEEGAHTQLLRAEGEYAFLFNQQANQYGTVPEKV